MSVLAQKDIEIEKQTLSLQEQHVQVENLNKRLEQSSKMLEAESTKLQEQLEDGPTVGETLVTTTSATADADRGRPDHVTVPEGLMWSIQSKKDDFKDVVRCGIIQQDLYRSQNLVQLKLPHSDPFYSNLPRSIPKPCNESDVGVKHACEHFHELYIEAEFHMHVRMCRLKFKHHEKQCGKSRTSGMAPEVLEQLPPIKGFDVLDQSISGLSASPTLQFVEQMKIAIIGTLPPETVICALQPYSDQDYACCKLPWPVEKLSPLPTNWIGDKFAGKIHCRHCTDWYKETDFYAHLDACSSFHKGHGVRPPHARCKFCGDRFQNNAGFGLHVTLCKQYPTKGSCIFCTELFDLANGEFTEHVPSCYKNPDRVYNEEKRSRKHRQQKTTELDPQTRASAGDSTAHTTSSTSASTPATVGASAPPACEGSRRSTAK